MRGILTYCLCWTADSSNLVSVLVHYCSSTAAGAVYNSSQRSLWRHCESTSCPCPILTIMWLSAHICLSVALCFMFTLQHRPDTRTTIMWTTEKWTCLLMESKCSTSVYMMLLFFKKYFPKWIWWWIKAHVLKQVEKWKMDECSSGRHYQAGKQWVCHSKFIVLILNATFIKHFLGGEIMVNN